MLCALNPEELIPKQHPLRGIKRLADEALERLDEELSSMYSGIGRPSVPPERLLKSMLLMALFSVRSDRQFCEQLRYNLLFRWFLDMSMVDSVFDHSTFTANRERLLNHDIARQLFAAVVEQARGAGLVSAEHFSVDGTLIEAWASMKSFRAKDGSDAEPADVKGGRGRNAWTNFRGKTRKNDTHASTTDPEARLIRKGRGKEAKLSFMAHALMENRNGLLVDFRISEATGTAEREAAIDMLEAMERRGPITLGADAGYDVFAFRQQCEHLGVTPHIARRSRKAWVDKNRVAPPDTQQTAADYQVSQRIRKRIEEPFGWLKVVAGFRKTRFRGKARVGLQGLMAAAALNLLRIAKLSSA